MIEHHLPILLVVIPLLAGPVCMLLRNGRWCWGLATAASITTMIIAAALLRIALAQGTISYLLGGWAAPWGIEYRVDTVNALVVLIVSAISTVTLPFARTSIESEVDAHRIPALYTGWLLCIAGLLGIAVTGDAFNIFVFLEISSLSMYLLIGLGHDRRALTAAYRYLILGTIGATFILIGIAFLFMMTGTLNIADLSDRIPAVSETRTVQIAFAFLTVGIAIKAAVFPLHAWLPAAYTYAPSAVTALLAGTATKVSVYLLLRFFFTLFGPAFSFTTMELDLVLLPLAIVAVFAMSTAAVFSNDIKRMLAFSSVAQIGYMVLGICLVNLNGVTAAILHLFNHALMKTALFLALGAVVLRVGGVGISQIEGLGKYMPWTCAAFVVGGLSLIGVPLTVGFISKWYLILGALDQHWWWLAALILLSSLLALVYVWRVVEAMYFRPAVNSQITEAPVSMLLPTWVLILANLYFGIDTQLSVGTARSAAAGLLGLAP